MFIKLFRLLKNLQSTQFSIHEIGIKLISHIYFEGDENNFIEFIKKNSKENQTDKDVNLIIERDFPLLYFMILLSEKLERSSGFTSIIKLSSDTKLKEVFNRVPKEHWDVFDKFYSENKETIKEVVYDVLGIDKLEKEVVKKKLFSTSKTNIANEFGVDIKTLNKWLKVFFNDRFKGLRKINYEEYVEIFQALFLAEDEELDLVENINTYKKRLSKGLKYRKKFIAEHTNEDSPLDVSTLLKIQKEQLGDIEFYNFTDVYPYSIAKLLVEKSGDEIGF
ncbi:hypothetical protein [Tenacibaculum soleae]|uniref:hypothetical protein n=1 Tax=Tenacibaculum soleae TaxID=447689 RepID=UPI002301682F|nr:hypothetical protein [Tenacibaculum soleae]